MGLRINSQLFPLVQETLTTLLIRTVALLEQLNVSYVLDSGSLLAQQRYGTFIPWDDDLDIRVNPKDWGRMQALRDMGKLNKTKDEVDLGNLHVDSRARILHKKREIQFRVYNVGFVGRNSMTLMDDIHADVVEANFVVSRVWENIGFVFSAPLRTVKFAGVVVTIPSTTFTERVLTKQFGANWMSPPREFRELDLLMRTEENKFK